MAVELNKRFSLKSFEDLKSIASQAWGHGIGEKSKGGKGYMGIMKGSDGTFSVFKCLTHSDEYKDFEKSRYPEFEPELKEASAFLKTTLLRLGKEAGVEAGILEDILNDFTGGKDGYLNRQMVAKAVTEIAKCAVKGGDAAEFWKGITYTGKVHNTKLKQKTSEGGASIEFVSNADQRNITALKSVKEMATVSNERPTTLKELEDCLLNDNGDFGKEMFELLDAGIWKINENCPNACNCFSGDPAWLFDHHQNEIGGHRTLAKPEQLTNLWDKVRLKMFQSSLIKSLGCLSAELKHNGKAKIEDRDIRNLFRRAYVRSGYAFAALKTACDVAKTRSIDCLFEKRLENWDFQEAVIGKTLSTMDEQFDNIENKDSLNRIKVAKDCLDGKYFDDYIDPESQDKITNGDGKEPIVKYYDMETTYDEKRTIEDVVKNSVAFVYSGIKAEGKEAVSFKDGENTKFKDDQGRDVLLSDDDNYKFNRYNNGDERNGDVFVERMFQ